MMHALKPSLLSISGLGVRFGPTQVVRGIDLTIAPGESVAVLGESGSGKSVTGKAVMGLINPPGRVEGSVRFEGEELVGRSEADMKAVRGPGIAMVFQDSLDALNPVYSVGDQIMEILTVRLGWSRHQARSEAIRLMEQVGISQPENRLKDYPHQFSGGMRQRICIAMAIALKPKLLIADEPTTALDVTVQAGILNLINRLRADTGMALLFVTHDLAVARRVAHSLIIMYAGRIVERGTVDDIFVRPAHPYTRALLASNPGSVRHWSQLQPISGSPPDKAARFAGCAFAPRCPRAEARCTDEAPELRRILPNRESRCHFAEEIAHA
ncbi:ABC transporter ATP-binding protein [Neorhizobium galegae]|uniref:Oligopeptide transport ATP-binding protein OppD n=1 Tax=Neorhizobium galegae bv. orientalis str. HAMBI 540 TaxID=1028800 RepID=A0A068T1M8_NEOGA|nr:ABC transporter ATP-binding protein [Neorhizobium galegae]MCQ1854590.1 ABC transporter ATP-binding protein [Neorhizobium galegae]CDN51946.1 Oligopeptide transport ATP-binding protein OppD [Neorhizobium galegae bv. orientalis str. HAMBI 540]CDZ51531.1 Oligopeptide transport ATP-binding protein OppD [Neorhizobium galegae bv. orientalis]